MNIGESGWIDGMRILIVDDHPIVAGGMERLTEYDEQLDVTISISAEEALTFIKQTVFDVLIFDLKMKETSGIELTKQVMQIKPGSRILIMSGHDLAPYINLILDSGAAGWMSKETPYEDMIQMIRQCVQGYAVVPIAMLQQMRRTMIRTTETDWKSMLTEREATVLFAASLGKFNKEIADEMNLAQRTVEKDLSQIYRKFNVQSRAEAIHFAERHGMLNKGFVD